MGVPVPGEAALVLAAIYAGVTGQLNIAGVVAAATVGAILGDNGGYWLGRTIGLSLLLRYGRYALISEGKIKLGRYLFDRHGGKVVFFGRFVAVLRVLAAFLAGLNHMPWPRFVAFNIAGGVLWAAVFGFGAYLLGSQFHHLTGPLGYGAVGIAALAVTASVVLFRRHERHLIEKAELAYPDPLI